MLGGVPSVGARGWVRQAVTGGIVAGIGGAVVLTLVRLVLGTTFFWVVSLVVGSTSAYPARYARESIWVAVKLPAYLFVGERALDPGFEASVVFLGAVNHLILSICWGVLFGLLAHGLSRRATIALGVLWGIVMWFVSYYVILPMIGVGPLGGRPGVVIEFLPYGLAMAIAFLLWQRRVHGRPPASEFAGG